MTVQQYSQPDSPPLPLKELKKTSNNNLDIKAAFILSSHYPAPLPSPQLSDNGNQISSSSAGDPPSTTTSSSFSEASSENSQVCPLNSLQVSPLDVLASLTFQQPTTKAPKAKKTGKKCVHNRIQSFCVPCRGRYKILSLFNG